MYRIFMLSYSVLSGSSYMYITLDDHSRITFIHFKLIINFDIPREIKLIVMLEYCFRISSSHYLLHYLLNTHPIKS